MKPTTVLTSSGRKRARPHRRAPPASAGRRRDARRRRARCLARSRNTSRCRRRVPRLKRQRRRAAPRPAARDRCRSSCWRPRVPAIDWNTRSTGEPRAIRSSVVVTCASTQLWVGMSSLSAELVEHGEQRVRPLRAVGRGIDADDGIAGAEQQAVENAGGDAARDRRSDDWAAAAPTAGRAARWCCGSA